MPSPRTIERLRILGGGIVLLAAVALVYAPAFEGGYVWDDEAHVTRPELRTLAGLRGIWLEPGVTQQYYPLTHSAFWLEHRLWGGSPLGHHLVGVCLHALSAFLVWRLLVRLGVPAAWLAGAFFALHPVHVESVAWISELKNMLSGALYLASMLVYLRFDDRRGRGLYALASLLFVGALLAKTVTATLPVAILVVLWWKRGRLDPRRDVVPLLPWTAVGAAMGLLTAWVERHHIGAFGPDFAFGWIGRCLIAGRAFWFYLGKLCFPVDLVFIYPRWKIDAGVAWQYLFPAAAVALVVALWVQRHRTGRGPLAAVLYFGITLFPALGFVNVYPFKFSFVADHFQYLASLGPITLLVASAASGIERLPLGLRRLGLVAAAVLLAALGLLSCRQARLYDDALTLWLETTRRNPGSAMAFNNLGFEYTKRGRYVEGLAAYESAIALEPGFAQAHFNAARTLGRLGRGEEAIDSYRRAIDFQPTFVMAYNNLGAQLGKLDRHPESVAAFRKAAELDPNFAPAQFNLGLGLLKLGETAAAIDALSRAVALDPDGEHGRNAAARLRDLGAPAP